MFKLSPLDDYHKYMAIPDEEVELKPPPYEPSENLKGWLLDEQARDQYVVRYNEETEIWWNDAVKGQQDADPAYAKRNWTDTYINWSPRGTYLATFHRLGIMLWGGPSWKKLLKLTHGGVKLIDFSPCENFVVTWSPETNQDKALIVWSVKTGAKLREFQGHVPKEGGPDHMEWPAFRWSHDDSYFARLGDDCIYVYESTTMKLIKDKAEKRTSVPPPFPLTPFPLSPTSPFPFPFSGADGRRALVPVVALRQPRVALDPRAPQPAGEGRADGAALAHEIRQKNLFNVADIRLTWHPQGHFLCVKVDKHSKSKKTLNSAFELFRVLDKDVPIEVKEFDKDKVIVAFAWEPKGLRFACVVGEGGSQRMDVTLYTMGSKHNGRYSELKNFERKPADRLFWSPAGNILLLANLKGTAGQLEWVDANTQQTIGEADHFMCSDIEWDPTGRFVATSVSHWKHQMENGFNVWSSHGRELDRVRHEKMYQFLWRPRPPSLLPEAKEKEIRKNLRDYAKQFEEIDAKLKMGMAGDLLKQRREKSAAFEEFLRAKAEEWAAQRQTRIDLRGGAESDNESAYTLVEEVDEVELDFKEEVVDYGGRRDSD